MHRARRISRYGLIAVAMLAVAMSVIGCGTKRIELPVRLSRLDQSPACKATLAGSERPMNAYLIELFEFEGPTNTPTTDVFSLCTQCLSFGGCVRVTTQCRCGGDVATTQENLGTALAGLRFDAIASRINYCMRVVAIELEETAPESLNAAACPCGVVLPRLTRDERLSHARICSLPARPFTTESNEIPLQLSCKDDPAQQGSQSDFESCLALEPF